MASTKIVKIDPLNPDENLTKEAAQVLVQGGLVIIPTETVYGIAANMADKRALDRLYEIKQRPKDKPFSLHISKLEELEEVASDIPVCAYKLMDKFWPGPLTIVLKSKDKGSIGVRMPDNKIALKIIEQAGLSVACPSANLSGRQAPNNFQEAIQDLNGLVDFAIDAGSTKLGVESTLVDLTVEPLKVLREGAVKKADIEAVAGKKTVLFICTGNSCRSVMAKGLLEKRLKEHNRQDVEVLSAGILMLSGLGATEEVKELLKAEGVDVSAHRSQRVTKGMLQKSDLVLVMEKMHEDRLLELYPEIKNRVFLLKEFAKISDNHLNIEDPIGSSEDFYRKTFAIIKEAIEKISTII